jgi:hypothetical protein
VLLYQVLEYHVLLYQVLEYHVLLYQVLEYQVLLYQVLEYHVLLVHSPDKYVGTSSSVFWTVNSPTTGDMIGTGLPSASSTGLP